jgi:hypothetical protein
MAMSAEADGEHHQPPQLKDAEFGEGKGLWGGGNSHNAGGTC